MDKYSVMTTEEESKLGEECGVFGIIACLIGLYL